jgi:hypothetical protein
MASLHQIVLDRIYSVQNAADLAVELGLSHWTIGNVLRRQIAHERVARGLPELPMMKAPVEENGYPEKAELGWTFLHLQLTYK